MEKLQVLSKWLTNLSRRKIVVNFLRYVSLYRFVTESDEFKRAWRFQLEYEPQEGFDYSWVSEYSKDEFDRISRSVDLLDEKADSLIRYLGAGSVFVSLAAFLANIEDYRFMYAIVPTLIIFVLSLGCAILARKPQFHPAPPYTEEAFSFVDYFKDSKGAQIRFAAKVGTASVAMKLANEFKARLVRWSFRFFFWGIVYLIASTIYVQFVLF